MDIDCGSISASLIASKPANIDSGKQLKWITTKNEGVPANLISRHDHVFASLAFIYFYFL